MTSTSLSRRSALRGAAFSTIATAIPATVATAIGAPSTVVAEAAGADPIIAKIAEYCRVKALAKAASARTKAISVAWNDDLSGCGWPPADYSIPEIADMKEWLEERSPACGFNGRVDRRDVLAFNAELLAWDAKHEPDLLEQSRKDNAARLAWIDQRVEERKHNAEVSGYRRAADESEALWGQAGDLCQEALETTAATVAGAWARLALAASTLRIDHTIDGELTDDIDIGGVLGAVADLERWASCRDRCSHEHPDRHPPRRYQGHRAGRPRNGAVGSADARRWQLRSSHDRCRGGNHPALYVARRKFGRPSGAGGLRRLPPNIL
jgi:hypothetical protein